MSSAATAAPRRTSPPQVARAEPAPVPTPARSHAEIARLREALSEQLRAGVPLLSWCAGDKAAAEQPTCAQLRRSAAQASFYLSLVASHGRVHAAQLRGILGALQQRQGAVQQVAAMAAPAQGVPQQAELVRTVQQLPGDFAHHTMPSVIAVNSSESATLSVNPLTADELKGVGRLSARLTVLEGDAVEVVGLPKPGARFMWVWTLVGLHEGDASVRTELFIDPPADGGAHLTPIKYGAWEDHITVQQPSLFAGGRGTGLWWLLGGTAAAALATGMWLRFRPGGLRILRGPTPGAGA